jgi:hypothetical protein
MRCSIEEVFFECMKNAKVAYVKYLLSKHPRLVHSKKGFYQKTPLDFVISYYMYTPKEARDLREAYWSIIKMLIECGGKCSVSSGIPAEVSSYILKVIRRKRACAKTLRVFMGLKKHKRKSDLFQYLNKDVMRLISKTLLFDEAGGKLEWDE